MDCPVALFLGLAELFTLILAHLHASIISTEIYWYSGYNEEADGTWLVSGEKMKALVVRISKNCTSISFPLGPLSRWIQLPCVIGKPWNTSLKIKGSNFFLGGGVAVVVGFVLFSLGFLPVQLCDIHPDTFIADILPLQHQDDSQLELKFRAGCSSFNDKPQSCLLFHSFSLLLASVTLWSLSSPALCLGANSL